MTKLTPTVIRRRIIGRRIRERRLALVLSVKALAKAAGVQKFQIRGYEAGRYSPKWPGNATRLAAALGWTIEELMP